MTFPLTARNAPLETFYYNMESPVCVSSVPTAELQTATFFCGSHIQQQEVIKLVASCKLRMLEMSGWNWESVEMFSSPALSHLDVWPARGVRGPILGQLPNLIHLRLRTTGVQDGETEVIWPPLPSLSSLDISIIFDSGPHLKRILQGTRQLVALNGTRNRPTPE